MKKLENMTGASKAALAGTSSNENLKPNSDRNYPQTTTNNSSVRQLISNQQSPNKKKSKREKSTTNIVEGGLTNIDLPKEYTNSKASMGQPQPIEKVKKKKIPKVSFE